jgi:hypothetical protein
MAHHNEYAMTYSLFLFIVVILTALVFGGGGALNVVETGTLSTLKWGISMIPYALLAWGTILSFITLEFRYLIAPLIGAEAIVLSTVFNFIFGKFLPTFVSSTSAILTYYTYDYIVEHIKDNPMRNVMMSTFAFLVLLAQCLSTKPDPAGTYLFTSSLLNDGLAAIFGVSIGLSGWFTVSSTNPDLLPYTGRSTTGVGIPVPVTSTPYGGLETGKYLAGCASDGCKVYNDMSSAMDACDKDPTCGGITGNATQSSWTLRAGKTLINSPTKEVSRVKTS